MDYKYSFLQFIFQIVRILTNDTWLVLDEEFEDTKGVIRISKSKKDRQHNGQKKKDKGQTTFYKSYT